jgi:hypothetical protein
VAVAEIEKQKAFAKPITDWNERDVLRGPDVDADRRLNQRTSSGRWP